MVMGEEHTVVPGRSILTVFRLLTLLRTDTANQFAPTWKKVWFTRLQ